jgi:hypothetical protein
VLGNRSLVGAIFIVNLTALTQLSCMLRPRLGRPPKPHSKKSRARHFSCYDQEWHAVRAVTDAFNLKTPFDLVRMLMRRLNHDLAPRDTFIQPQADKQREGG